MINHSPFRIPMNPQQKGLGRFLQATSHLNRRPRKYTKHASQLVLEDLPVYSHLLLSILFNALIFKSKKLKGSNKPLCFPIPPPQHKSWRTIIFMVSDKVMVIWPCSRRAHTETKSPQGTGGADRSTRRLFQGAPLLQGSHPLAATRSHPPSSAPGPRASQPQQSKWSLSFPAGGRGPIFLALKCPGLLFLQAELVFYKWYCWLVWPFQTFSLGNCSGCFAPHLIPVLLPVWQILNVSWYSNWDCHLFVH